MLSAFFGGAIVPVPSVTAETWSYDPASTTVDELDPFTYEFGDDVQDDWFQLGDGVLSSVEFTGPEGLGVLTATMTWRFGSFASSGSTDFPTGASGDPQVPTAGLDLDTHAVYVYLKDMGIFIASDPADLDSNQIMDALHTFTLRLTPGDRPQAVRQRGPVVRHRRLRPGRADHRARVHLRQDRGHRRHRLRVRRVDERRRPSTATSRFGSRPTVEAETAVPYSWDWTMPMRYYTRTEGEVGGNTTVVLTGHAFYDPVGSGSGGLNAVVLTEVVNTLTEAELGVVGS